MKVNYSLIGRLTYTMNPEAALNLQKRYTPALTDFSLIPKIYELIKKAYPELDRTDTNILFAASVYRLFSPASLLAARCANAPANLRRGLADVLGYENGTNINYFMSMARAHVKNPRYVKKIESIASMIDTINEMNS